MSSRRKSAKKYKARQSTKAPSEIRASTSIGSSHFHFFGLCDLVSAGQFTQLSKVLDLHVASFLPVNDALAMEKSHRNFSLTDAFWTHYWQQLMRSIAREVGVEKLLPASDGSKDSRQVKGKRAGKTQSALATLLDARHACLRWAQLERSATNSKLASEAKARSIHVSVHDVCLQKALLALVDRSVGPRPEIKKPRDECCPPQYQEENQEHLGVEFEWSDEQLRQAKAIARLVWYAPGLHHAIPNAEMGEYAQLFAIAQTVHLLAPNRFCFELLLSEEGGWDECYWNTLFLHIRLPNVSSRRGAVD